MGGPGGGKASAKNQPLKIVEVFIDFGTEEIEIVVENLGSGPGPLAVGLGDAGNFGDITSLCSEDLVSMPQVVTCDFSALGLPANGDYLLTVRTGKASKKGKASTKSRDYDEYALTIAEPAGGSGPPTPRFEDCGDGTVADHDTGLQWEKKTDDGSVHDKDNRYQWSNTVPSPNGGAFTDFLAKLNNTSQTATWTTSSFTDVGTQDSGCFAVHCDWRLPNIVELRTILIGPHAAPGQATTCGSGRCIDPDFAAVGGPTVSADYWSASTNAGSLNGAWSAFFNNGTVNNKIKLLDLFVRAVRAGSCH